MKPKEDSHDGGGGLPFALAAYFLWGVVPLYIALLVTVDPLRFVAWRILWTIPICLAALLATRRLAQIRTAFSDGRTICLLLVTSALIAANWLIYVMAVVSGHIYAASLGYYINPLLNILLGTVFLRERLSRLQWLAVAIAAAGIAVLAKDAAATLVMSVLLAATFAVYGLIRKLLPVGAMQGLMAEVLILALPSVAVLAFYPRGAADFGDGLRISLLLVGSGFITGIPLMLFAAAARRMDYSALGFVQFLAPTMVFLFGLFLFQEELKSAQAISFALIWAAIALFCGDILVRRQARGRAYRADAKRNGSPTA